MKQNSQRTYWLNSGIINILQNVIGQVLSLGAFWLMARLFTKEDLGAWGIYTAAILIFELLRNGLTQSAIIKFLSGSDDKNRSEIFTAGAGISAALTVACIILNLIFATYLSRLLRAPQLEPVFYLYNIVFLLSGVLTQLCCIEQANFQYKGVFVVNFIRQSALFIYPLYCFIFNHQLTLLALVYTQIISMIFSIIGSWYYVRHFFNFRYIVNWAWVKKIFNYGKFAFGTSISAQLAGTIDQWMLASMLSPAASASFSTAVRITNLINVPTDAVATIVFPQSAKRIETEGKNAIKYLYEKSVGTLMAVLIPAVIFIYLFAGIIVEMIAGGKYADSVPILYVTLLYCLMIPYGRQFGTILDSIGKTKLTFTIVIITAASNLFLNIYFIPKYGAIGAAYASLVSNIIGFVIAQYILYRELGVNVLHTFIYAWKFYPEFINKYILKKENY